MIPSASVATQVSNHCVASSLLKVGSSLCDDQKLQSQHVMPAQYTKLMPAADQHDATSTDGKTAVLVPLRLRSVKQFADDDTAALVPLSLCEIGPMKHFAVLTMYQEHITHARPAEWVHCKACKLTMRLLSSAEWLLLCC